MRKIKALFLICTLVVTFCACEEFDDGGSRYQSHKNILGQWKYTEFVNNGSPIEKELFDSIYLNSSIEFEKGSTAVVLWKNQYDSLLQKQTANYVFNHNKQTLRITYQSYPTVNQTYFVKRLTEDELWLEYYETDGTYSKFKMNKVAQ